MLAFYRKQDESDTTAANMATKFKHIILLEELQRWDDTAATLWQDIVFLRSSAVRLSYELFHRDGMRPSSTAGRHLMKRLHAHR